MSGTITNKKNKFIRFYTDERAYKQVSIDACNNRRTMNRIAREERNRQNEERILKEMKNLNKPIIIIFAEIGDEIVIITILDFKLLNSDYSVGMKYHLMYGLDKYEKLNMTASYTYRGKRLIKQYYSTYTVSTDDGIHFDVIDTDGTKITSFETLIQYESLAGKSSSGVIFDQFLYEPHKCASDKDTAMFHTELDRLIQADRQKVEIHPELGEGYIPYHQGL